MSSNLIHIIVCSNRIICVGRTREASCCRSRNCSWPDEFIVTRIICSRNGNHIWIKFYIYFFLFLGMSQAFLYAFFVLMFKATFKSAELKIRKKIAVGNLFFKNKQLGNV